MKTFAKTVTLTSTQVNALNGTPIVVVPAPQSGYALVPQNLIIAKTSGTAVGTSAGAIGLGYDGTSTLVVSIAQATAQSVLATGATAATYTSAVSAGSAGAGVYAGKAIDISAGGAVASFDGTLQVTVLFNIVKIG
jgi:hypothetical protein